MSKVRAARDGARRPCSQSCNVRTDTPSNCAKRVCDRPVFSRVLPTSGTLITRPIWPRLISRRPRRISAPTSRVFFLSILHLFANLTQHLGGNLVFDILGVHGQHPDQALLHFREVNDAITTAFSPASRPPTQLAHSTRAGNDTSGPGLLDQSFLKLLILIIGKILLDESGEELRFDETKHQFIVR